MIINFYQNWFNHPAVATIELNRCNYGCSYCYSKCGRTLKANLKSDIALIRRSQKDQSNLQKFMLGNGYMVCLSNMTDPFCCNNIELSEILAQELKDNGNSIFWQTKGGDNNKIMRILEKDFNNILFLTIETLDQTLLSQYAPDAPTVKSRLELLDWWLDAGGEVILGINPIINVEELPVIYALYKDKVRYIFVNPINSGRKEAAELDEAVIKYKFELDTEHNKIINCGVPICNFWFPKHKVFPNFHSVNWVLDKFPDYWEGDGDGRWITYDTMVELLLLQGDYFQEVIDYEPFPCNQWHFGKHKVKDLDEASKFKRFEDYLRWYVPRYGLPLL